MKIGLLVPVSAPYATREFVRTLGSLAEDAGFHALWVGEHVVVPAESTSEYPVSDDGALPDAIRFGELDPYTTLTYLAATTERIRLGACTTVPQRNPVYTAKEIANADWLSGGRVEVGVGVGWSREEFDAVAAPFARRGERCDSYLRVMKRCWEDPVAEIRDEFYELPPSLLYPKPIQRPHPPLHVLGNSRFAIDRAARLGDGFFPLDVGPDDMVPLLAGLDRCLEREGRTRRDVRIAASPYTRDCDLSAIQRYREVGVDEVILFRFVQDLDAMRRAVDEFYDTIVEPARRI